MKDACVQKIKALQRSSEDAKKQWWNFCDSQQGGVRDPTRHTVRVLQEFLSGLGCLWKNDRSFQECKLSLVDYKTENDTVR